MTERDRARAILEQWLDEHSTRLPIHSELSDWDVGIFRDAFIFSPGAGRLGNRLYFVRGDHVAPFTPSIESIETAYARLDE